MIKRWLLGGLLLAALAACGDFPGGKAVISGYVVDMKAGEPVVGSTVKVVQTGDVATTDENGYYAIEVPPGGYTLTFRKDGYATSKVVGLVTLEAGTRYSTIQRPRFDPAVPVEPPRLRVQVPDWYEPGDEVTIKVRGQVHSPSANGFVYLDVAIGQQGGNSGYLNGFVRHERVFGFDGSEVEVSLSTEGYSNIVPVYVVAYDANGNRTEVIRYIYRENSGEQPVPLAPQNLTGEAITFGDVAVFGTLSTPSVTASGIVNALKAGNLEKLESMAREIQQARAGIGLMGDELRKAISWVDLSFEYDPEANPPEAFEIFRKRADEEDFFKVGRIAAADAQVDEGSYAFRDASPGVQPGVQLTYRVDAVNGDQRASSETFSLTPLPPFYVEAISPADNVAGVDLAPGYVMSLENSADVNVLAVIVLDRVQSDGFDIEYFSPIFYVAGQDGPFHPFNGFEGIPHGVVETDSGYGLSGAMLQPFRAYEWMPFAVTVSLNETGTAIEAASIAADFFNLWGPFAVEDGPVNTFVTGDGGGQ